MKNNRLRRWANPLDVIVEAMKYSKKVDFRRNSSGAYKAAVRFGILVECYSHMENKRVIWDEDSVHTESLKHNTRTDFARSSPGAYRAAKKLGVFDKVTSHLPLNLSGREGYRGEETTLYLIDVIGFGMKPGLTKSKVKFRYSSDIDVNIIYSIVFPEGLDAFDLENDILQMTKKHQIYSPKDIGPLLTGNTEIRDYSIREELIEAFEEIKILLISS